MAVNCNVSPLDFLRVVDHPQIDAVEFGIPNMVFLKQTKGRVLDCACLASPGNKGHTSSSNCPSNKRLLGADFVTPELVGIQRVFGWHATKPVQRSDVGIVESSAAKSLGDIQVVV